MKALKIFATTVLCFFLFIFLIIFSITFTVNNTILNVDFITEQISNFDISSMVDSSINQFMGTGTAMPKEIAAIINTELKSIIEQNLASYVKSFYNYFLADVDKLNIIISLESIRKKVKATMLQQTIEATMAKLKVKELSATDKQRIEQQFNTEWEKSDQVFPSQIDFSAMILNPEFQEMFKTVKQALGIYQTSFIILIVTMIFFIFLIVMLNLNLKAAPRLLGIIILSVGLIQLFTCIFYGVIQNDLLKSILPVDIPDSAYQGTFQLIKNTIALFQTLSLVFLIIGAVLILISIILPKILKKQPQENNTERSMF